MVVYHALKPAIHELEVREATAQATLAANSTTTSRKYA